MPTDILQIGTKVWLKPRPAFPFDPYGDYEGVDIGNAEWMFSALLPMLGGQVAGLSGKVTAGQLTNNNDWRLYAQSILGKALTDHQTQTYNTRNIEKPYVGFNYVLLDEQFKYVPEGSGFVDANNDTTLQTLATGQMVVQKSGYLTVTTVVGTPSFNAYFDNLSILHRSGPLVQESDTYAFGGVIDALESRSFGRAENKYGYNGKEKQPDLGLEWLDYGARIYDAQVGRWGVVDPHSDSYHSWSPYNYCYNDPNYFVDPTGNDAVVTGSGTKDCPYMIQATYFYFGLTGEQSEALKGSLSEFNNDGKSFSFKVGEETFYVQFFLAATEVADGDAAKMESDGAFVRMPDGSNARNGNIVSTFDNLKGAGLVKGNSGSEYAFASANRVIAINEFKIRSDIKAYPGRDKKLESYTKVLSSALTHEVGHNLAASHGDPGKLMQKLYQNEINSTSVVGGPTGTYNWSYAGVDNSSIRALSGRMGMTEGSTNSNFITAKEHQKVLKAEDPGIVGKLIKL